MKPTAAWSRGYPAASCHMRTWRAVSPGGDFDIPLTGRCRSRPLRVTGARFSDQRSGQNTVPDKTWSGMPPDKRAYINGLGHIYQTGITTHTGIPGAVRQPQPTLPKFRINRIGSIVTVWYWKTA